jgi:hypothetical protein
MDNHQRLQRVMHHIRAATTAPPPSNVATPIQQHGSSRQHFRGWMNDRWHDDPLGPPTSVFGESTDVHTTARACATSNTAQPAIPIITTDCVLFHLGYLLKTGQLTIGYGKDHHMYFKTRQSPPPGQTTVTVISFKLPTQISLIRDRNDEATDITCQRGSARQCSKSHMHFKGKAHF